MTLLLTGYLFSFVMMKTQLYSFQSETDGREGIFEGQ